MAINDLAPLASSSPLTGTGFKDIAELVAALRAKNTRALARAITLVENNDPLAATLMSYVAEEQVQAVTLGITGAGGSGKSTLTGQLLAHYRRLGRRIGVVAIDPSSSLSGGAILGDRIRMMHLATDPEVIVRSMATRGRIGGLCAAAGAAVRLLAFAGCNPVLIETVGVGQAEIDIVSLADLTMLVLAPGLGDDIQAMKAGLIELADILVVNKGDLPAAEALLLEMERVASERQRRLVRTVATTGSGIPELVRAVEEVDHERQASGAKATKRLRNQQREALDLVLETVREHLEQGLKLDEQHYLGDPREIAKRLLQEKVVLGNFS